MVNLYLIIFDNIVKYLIYGRLSLKLYPASLPLPWIYERKFIKSFDSSQ